MRDDPVPSTATAIVFVVFVAVLFAAVIGTVVYSARINLTPVATTSPDVGAAMRASRLKAAIAAARHEGYKAGLAAAPPTRRCTLERVARDWGMGGHLRCQLEGVGDHRAWSQTMAGQEP